MRIFRGSLPEGCGPFTKDLCYSKGFVLIYNYIRLAVGRGMLRRVPLLFCGKTTLCDIKTIAQLVDEGLVTPPRFVPPQFADLQRAVGVDVLRQLPQPPVAEAHRGRLRGAVLTVIPRWPPCGRLLEWCRRPDPRARRPWTLLTGGSPSCFVSTSAARAATATA